MRQRAFFGLAGFSLFTLLSLSACSGGGALRRFGPAGPEDVREALSAWTAAQQRADGLSASRLLYDAKMGNSGLPSVPGTLAVTYEGSRVRSASLTGPFGSRIANYGDGMITGDDRKAFVVDPVALRSVLAGVWRGAPDAPVVAGRDGADCLLTWSGGANAYRAEAVLDLQARQLRSLVLSGNGGRLTISYAGEFRPWPQRIALKEDSSGRSLSLSLIATEPLGSAPAASPSARP
ncbi:MAG TPA: hypothetical protein VGK26_07560 [Thermoanaerobaculia bacterium]